MIANYPTNPRVRAYRKAHSEFSFAVVPTHAGDHLTPADAIRLQFMMKDVFAATHEMEDRGIALNHSPQPTLSGSAPAISEFHTPNGFTVELWGIKQPTDAPGELLKALDQDGEKDGNHESDDDDLQEEEDDEILEDDHLTEDDEGELVDDEDTDVDETGLPIDDEDDDEDEEEYPLEEDESGDEEDEDFDEEFDLEDDDFDLDEDDDDDEFDA